MARLCGYRGSLLITWFARLCTGPRRSLVYPAPLDTEESLHPVKQRRRCSRNDEEAEIAMARGLHLEVIAEGVETQQQYDLLRRLGCHKAQGFKCCRPLPAEEFVQWVSENTLQLT